MSYCCPYLPYRNSPATSIHVPSLSFLSWLPAPLLVEEMLQSRGTPMSSLVDLVSADDSPQACLAIHCS